MANVRFRNTMLFKYITYELNREKLVNIARFIIIVLSNFIKPLRIFYLIL